MNVALDKRLHAFRPDLADRRLEGQVEAKRFVEGVLRRIAVSSTPIRRAPRFDASIDSEALMGERVRVFEDTMEGWAWAQLETDGYVGYIASEALGAVEPTPTHRVTAVRTFLYPAADMKFPPLAALSLGSQLTFTDEAETRGMRYFLLANGQGAVVASHVQPIGEALEPDYVAVAERFLNAPYLWGGRTSLGIDCSGLVQLSLAATGIAAPRDSDQQAASLGQALAGGPGDELRRGDLVFWPGHVGMLQDSATLLHASGSAMQVVSEPLAPAIERIAKTSGMPSAIRRL
jgi:cell wall-associated NlpC family hydrolase